MATLLYYVGIDTFLYTTQSAVQQDSQDSDKETDLLMTVMMSPLHSFMILWCNFQ